jgi:predicted TIM-barrel fold metal-dependent hydrolase
VKDACDCHVHVFGPASRFPYAAERAYTPPAASVEQLISLHDSIGIERVVIVQPSPYGTDNSCTLDAAKRLGRCARAVVVVDETSNLEDMHRVGARGIRVNLYTAGQNDPAAALQALQEAAGRAKPLGWHVQVFTTIGLMEQLESALRDFTVPLVVDHFGLPQDGKIDPLVRLVRRGVAYVKLSATHRFPADPAPLARALAEANPARVLWGTDWPHPGGAHGVRSRDASQSFDAIDDRAALARLAAWFPDANLRRKILVENPARLYDF